MMQHVFVMTHVKLSRSFVQSNRKLLLAIPTKNIFFWYTASQSEFVFAEVRCILLHLTLTFVIFSCIIEELENKWVYLQQNNANIVLKGWGLLCSGYIIPLNPCIHASHLEKHKGQLKAGL